MVQLGDFSADDNSFPSLKRVVSRGACRIKPDNTASVRSARAQLIPRLTRTFLCANIMRLNASLAEIVTRWENARTNSVAWARSECRSPFATLDPSDLGRYFGR